MTDVSECAPCAEYLASQPHLVGACASVGIEHGQSTQQTLRFYMQGVHTKEHHEQ